MASGANVVFAALRLRPGRELAAEADAEIRVVGAAPFAWFSKDTFEVLVVTTSKKVDARELCLPMLEPLLFYLALLANPEPNAKAIAAGVDLSGSCIVQQAVLEAGRTAGVTYGDCERRTHWRQAASHLVSCNGIG